MPTGWCAGKFPEELLSAADIAYREELIKRIPAAKDDRTYFEAYTQACAGHMLNSINRHAQEVFKKDKEWGLANRSARVLSHLQTFIDLSEKHKTLPALRSMAIQMLQSLKLQWKEATPLGFYPAFKEKK